MAERSTCGFIFQCKNQNIGFIEFFHSIVSGFTQQTIAQFTENARYLQYERLYHLRHESLTFH